MAVLLFCHIADINVIASAGCLPAIYMSASIDEFEFVLSISTHSNSLEYIIVGYSLHCHKVFLLICSMMDSVFIFTCAISAHILFKMAAKMALNI